MPWIVVQMVDCKMELKAMVHCCHAFSDPLALSPPHQGNVFQDAVFNQTVTVTEREDGLDGETYVNAFLVVNPLTYTLFSFSRI